MWTGKQEEGQGQRMARVNEQREGHRLARWLWYSVVFRASWTFSLFVADVARERARVSREKGGEQRLRSLFVFCFRLRRPFGQNGAVFGRCGDALIRASCSSCSHSKGRMPSAGHAGGEVVPRHTELVAAKVVDNETTFL